MAVPSAEAAARVVDPLVTTIDAGMQPADAFASVVPMSALRFVVRASTARPVRHGSGG